MKRFSALLIVLVLSFCVIGCTAQEPAVNVNFNDVMDQIESNVGFVDHMADMTANDISLLYGIEGSEITQYAGKYNDSGVLADEVIMLEAPDEAAAAAVRDKVQKRYDAKAAELKDYLPEEYSKLTACEVVQNGRFVSMFISADTKAMCDIFNAAF